MAIPLVCAAALLFALNLGSSATCSAAEPIAQKEVPIKIKITVPEKPTRWYVGDNIQATVTAKNVSNHDFYLVGWNETHEESAPEPEIRVEANEFPGRISGLMRLELSGWHFFPPMYPGGEYHKISPGWSRLQAFGLFPSIFPASSRYWRACTANSLS